jgi:hypothetical protein
LQLFVIISLAGSMALLGVAALDIAYGLIPLSLFVLFPAFIHFILTFPEPIRYLERYPRRIWWLYLPVPLGVIEFLIGSSFLVGPVPFDLFIYITYAIILTVAIILKWGGRDLRRYPGLWGMVVLIIASNIAAIVATVIFRLDAQTVLSTFGNGLNRWIAAYGSIFVSILIGVICSPIGYHLVQKQLGYSVVTQLSQRGEKQLIEL